MESDEIGGVYVHHNGREDVGRAVHVLAHPPITTAGDEEVPLECGDGNDEDA
jgi:hypothetical protein